MPFQTGGTRRRCITKARRKKRRRGMKGVQCHIWHPFFQTELKEPLSKVFGGTMRLFAQSLDENTYAKEEEEMKLHIRAQMPLVEACTN